MSATDRSSSGVRDLRAMFERKDSNNSVTSTSDRGRSPSGNSVNLQIGDGEKSPRGPRRVRSNFFSVGESGIMAAPGPQSPPVTGTPTIAHLKDKPVSADEDQTAVLNPADVKDEAVVSDGEGLGDPNLLESDGPKPVDKKATTSSSSTKAAPTKSPNSQDDGKKSDAMSNKLQEAKSKLTEKTKAAANAARPAGKRQSDGSAFVKPRPRSPTKPVALPAHLTQQTRSSAAKHEQEPAKKPTSSSSSSSTTRPLASLSHLMAPTASSRAKHEEEASKTDSAPATRKSRTSMLPSRTSTSGTNTAATTTRPKTTVGRASLGPAARSSTKPDENSRLSVGSSTKPSTTQRFLDRMAKPTGTTESRNQEKTAEKSESKPATRPSLGSTSRISPAITKPINGTPKKPSAPTRTSDAEKSVEPVPKVEEVIEPMKAAHPVEIPTGKSLDQTPKEAETSRDLSATTTSPQPKITKAVTPEAKELPILPKPKAIADEPKPASSNEPAQAKTVVSPQALSEKTPAPAQATPTTLKPDSSASASPSLVAPASSKTVEHLTKEKQSKNEARISLAKSSPTVVSPTATVNIPPAKALKTSDENKTPKDEAFVAPAKPAPVVEPATVAAANPVTMKPREEPGDSSSPKKETLAAQPEPSPNIKSPATTADPPKAVISDITNKNKSPKSDVSVGLSKSASAFESTAVPTDTQASKATAEAKSTPEKETFMDPTQPTSAAETSATLASLPTEPLGSLTAEKLPKEERAVNPTKTAPAVDLPVSRSDEKAGNDTAKISTPLVPDSQTDKPHDTKSPLPLSTSEKDSNSLQTSEKPTMSSEPTASKVPASLLASSASQETKAPPPKSPDDFAENMIAPGEKPKAADSGHTEDLLQLDETKKDPEASMASAAADTGTEDRSQIDVSKDEIKTDADIVDSDFMRHTPEFDGAVIR